MTMTPRCSLTILFFVFTLAASAQQYIVTGNVTDDQGSPLEMVAVSVKGTQNGTYTDASGAYELSVQPTDSLQFSLIGFQKQTVAVNHRKRLNVVLENSDFRFAELVVTGYSTQERRDITGSVSSVKLDEDVSFQTVDQMLQGRAPGVFMTSSSGALGAANVLTIRGLSSIIGDNNPLYVIDGVPIYGTDRSNNSADISGGAIAAISMGGMQTGGGTLDYNMDLKYSFEKNPLATLNPEDIESIEILKDAFATAIYGSRGANGVVLITTKKGMREHPRVNVSYTLGVDQIIGKPDLLNGDEYSQVYSSYFRGENYPKLYNTDWVDAVTRTAISHHTSASCSGGSQSTSYYISLSYDNNDSYVINNDLQRYAARLNLDTELSKQLKLGVNLSLSRLENNALQAQDIYSMAIRKAPNLPVYTPEGDYYYGYQPNARGTAEAYNPVAMAYINDESSDDTRAVGNMYITWNPISWLSWKTEVGMDIYNVFSNIRKGTLPESVTGVAGNQATETQRNNMKYVINNTLNVNKVFKQHFFQGIVGQSYEHSKERYMSVFGDKFFSPDLQGVGAAQTRRVQGAYARNSALFSAFARFNYQYQMKYMAGVTYRLDGSSHYNKNHRFLGTPSISAGWRFSREDFVHKALPFLDEGKIRASVGISSKDGNNNYYGSQAVYTLNSLTTYGGLKYLEMSQPSNANLDWERTVTWNVGLDLELFKRRVTLTLDWYTKKTTNMLFPSGLPYYTGYTTENQNVADMRNTGLDLQIVTQNINTKDWHWESILNLSLARNKILKLDGSRLDEMNSSYKYYAEGQPAAQWYLHKWAGVDSQTGDPLWEYADDTVSTVPPASNWKASENNKFVMGTAIPTFYGSLNNSLTWKNLELDIFFTYSVGSHMINATRASLLTYTQNAPNLSSEIMNMWQIPGQKTDIPRLNNASIIGAFDYTTAITTTRFLENNSYLRLKTLTLAYRVPQRLLTKTRILRQLRFHITVTNLFTITPYSGLDPEVSAFGSSVTAMGYDYSTLPLSRCYQFGVTATF
ncbi:MAG: TonB-dependent receptor [Bacteroidaceae bacterium]|nr:TonB-dependent receptor [Bacteroidaceae bacterium]